MRISVAMATYNGERFAADQLASIAAQTLTPHELVVCDDGSTDRTREIVREYAAHVPFAVHLHLNERRLGFADNFLRAASLCEGDAIAFSDQDDVWLAPKLKRCAAALAPPDIQLVIHSSEVVDEQMRPAGRSWPAAPALGAADPFFMPAGFAFLFRSDLLRLADTGARPRSRLGYEPMGTTSGSTSSQARPVRRCSLPSGLRSTVSAAPIRPACQPEGRGLRSPGRPLPARRGMRCWLNWQSSTPASSAD